MESYSALTHGLIIGSSVQGDPVRNWYPRSRLYDNVRSSDDLQMVNNDTELMKKLFQEHLQIHSYSILSVLVTKEQVLNQFKYDLAKTFKTSILYYAGHGDGESGRWCFENYKTIDHNEILQIWLSCANNQQKLIIISDSCYSGWWQHFLHGKNNIFVESACPSNMLTSDRRSFTSSLFFGHNIGNMCPAKCTQCNNFYCLSFYVSSAKNLRFTKCSQCLQDSKAANNKQIVDQDKAKTFWPLRELNVQTHKNHKHPLRVVTYSERKELSHRYKKEFHCDGCKAKRLTGDSISCTTCHYDLCASCAYEDAFCKMGATHGSHRHPLQKKFRHSDQRFRCDICQRKYRGDEWSMHCDICDWDVCQSCEKRDRILPRN